MKEKQIDMSRVVLTPEVVAAWTEIAKRLAGTLTQMGVSPGQIGEEELWLNEEGGSLVVKCKAGQLEATMVIPAGQWRWNNQN